jgi:hypothetical protein
VAASKTVQINTLIMEKLERMLAEWMEHKYQCAIPVSFMIVQADAKSLFD